MQVATAPYSASLPHLHYHPYYQLPPPGPQDHDLKRQYLALLPPQQIIEICLTFDVHVPPYIKSTIWPLDLNAAITHLQNTKNAAAENPPEQQEKPREDGNPMDSLESLAPNESSSSEQQVEKETEPRSPDKNPEDNNTATPGPSESTPVAPARSSSTSTENPSNLDTSSAAVTPANPEPSTSNTPVSQPALTPVPAVPATQPPQPATAYPYAYPQYPQPQYYAGGYAYPYAAYAPPPPPMQTGYAPAPPPAAPQIHQPYPTVTPTSIYNNVMPIVAPGQDGSVNPDDLPSYEEMIVEALTDCPDAEGWAPKDLFTWMAKRYPLQSNFRPSASQALQKAFKRGRFEKSSQGKYRLSASWEGGNTSRRTTRRPQTHPSISSQPSVTPSGPPFTHAPLVHHASAAQQPQPGYPAQPYGYQYQQQPIAYTQPAATTPVAASTSTITAAPKPAETTESSDAYEAAKTILNAINFGDLLKLPADNSANATDNRAQDDAEHQLIASGVENLLSHVQAALASSQANQPPVASDALSIPGASTSTAATSVAQPQSQEEQTGPRAELQAQLALLAAQLAELSQSENAPPAPEAIPPVISPLPQPIIPISAPTSSILQMHPQPELPPPMASLLPPPPPPPVTALSPALKLQPEPVPIPTAVQEPQPEPASPPAPEEQEEMDEQPLIPLQPPLQLDDMEDSDEDDDDMEEVI